MMMMSNFDEDFRRLLLQIRDRPGIPMNSWQSQDVVSKPGMSFSRELRHVTFRVDPMPDSANGLQELISPNLPWAEDHFLERVSGEALNPPPSEAYWPYAVRGNKAHKDGELFSHTYPERMWAKYANMGGETNLGRRISVPNVGIRFEYGDLTDLVRLLRRDPLTRQAYLPIWFPEDTGAVYGQRVPCTLGYHILMRPSIFYPEQYSAEIVYLIRSCDLLRHFTDDVYMACRLLQWIVGMLRETGMAVAASSLIMHISSLHTFEGDDTTIDHLLRKMSIVTEEDEPTYGAAV